MVDATVCLTYDFDAISPWLHGEGEMTPTERSRGLFGARVGVPRLLDLHERLDTPATFFVPGHTVESFPEACAAIDAAGHPIEHHGWSHTSPGAFEDRAAERADIERGIEAIRELTGDPPRGYRSPSWDHSSHTLELIEELGFRWDSSQMAGDFAPYYLRADWEAPPEGPYRAGQPTDVLEFPVSWDRDDYPAFATVPGRLEGQASESAVFARWRDQFEWMSEHVPDGVFTLTMHPQVIGRAPLIGRLGELITHLAEHEGVTFRTLDAVATRLRSAGDIPTE